MVAIVSEIFWLNFCTVGGSGDASSNFEDSRNTFRMLINNLLGFLMTYIKKDARLLCNKIHDGHKLGLKLHSVHTLCAHFTAVELLFKPDHLTSTT